MPRKAKNQEVDIKIVEKPYRKQVKGKGDYKSFFKNVYNKAKAIIPKGTFSFAGQALGGPVGALAGQLLSKITGMGNYSSNMQNIQHNALFKKHAQGNAVQIPQFRPGKHGVQVNHCEYIGDIVCGTGTPSVFTVNNYAVNPGLASTFPWLSQIASNFETYRFHGLVFEAKSLCTDNTATFAGLGSVIMCADYNAAAPNFINKFQMENYDGAVSAKPSQSLLFGLECDPRDLPENHLYIRANAVPSGQDQKTYDLAEFQIATVGMPVASQQICELWVSYSVDLMQPKLYAGQFGYGIGYSHYIATSGITTSAYFGTSPSLSSNSSMSLTLGTSTITFPSNIVTGNYMLVYAVRGTAGAATVCPTIAATTNCSIVKLLQNTNSVPVGGSGFALAAEQGTTPDTLSIVLFINVTGPSAVITFSVGTMPTSPVSMDLILTQMNGMATTAN